MKKNSRNTLIVTCVLATLFVSCFVYKWYSVKGSESYRLAIVAIKQKYPSTQEENINLLSYERSWPSRGTVTEHVHFKFELGENEIREIEMKKDGGVWTIMNAP